MLGTEGAVLVGLVYAFLPTAIFPIYAALNPIPPILIEAADDLGAGPIAAFLRVTLPLSLPGVMAAILFVFVPAMGAFAIPALLGGGKSIVIGNLIVQLFLEFRNIPLGAAVSSCCSQRPSPSSWSICGSSSAWRRPGHDEPLPGTSFPGKPLPSSSAGLLASRLEMFAARALSPTILVLAYVFLFAPLVVLIAYSFNAGRSTVVWSGFSFKWYEAVFADRNLGRAFLGQRDGRGRLPRARAQSSEPSRPWRSGGAASSGRLSSRRS